MSDVVIVTKNLTKYYGKHRGVEGLDIEVKKGEVFGYLGPNGAGKTTTIRLLLDFIRSSAGSAKIFGLDSRADSVKIKRQVGYLPGELHLYENLTGVGLLKFLASLRGRVDWEFIEQLAGRLKANLSQKIKSMSHGNRQKIGIIAAFMHRPKLLILDEPTAGLDPLMQHEFYHLVEGIKRAGNTVFMSSHIMPEVEKICDRVGFIRDGQLVEVQDVETLKERAPRPLEVLFAKPVSLKDFEAVVGVKDIKIEGAILRCTVIGSLDSFVKKIAEFEVVNIASQEPNLEDIFMTYYGEQ